VLRDNLVKLVWLWDEVQTTHVRQAKLAKDRVGGKSATTPLPWHEAASRASDLIHNTVHTWAIELDYVADYHIQPSRVKLTLEWMIRNVHAFARLENAGQPYRAFRGVMEHAMVTIDHPVDKIFIGRCDWENPDGCEVELFALPNEGDVECWLCHKSLPVAPRREYMLEAAENHVGHSSTLSRLLGHMGFDIPSSTIRHYAQHRNLTVMSIDSAGRPEYRLGEVMDLWKEFHKDKKPRRKLAA
jgi:hypothetical protein